MPIWEFSDFADVVDKARKIVPKYNRDVSISVDKEFLYINGMGMPTGPAGGTGMVLMGTENHAYWDVLPAVGATGLQGPQGVTGPFYGPPGETGLQGIQGVTGFQGMTGLSITGLQGPTGAYGGPQGATGIRGIQGIQGVTGLRGFTGVQGQTGPSGVEKYSFFATLTGSNISNATGGGTDYTLIFDDEMFDPYNVYNSSTGYFTCPSNGKYYFNAKVTINYASNVKKYATLSLIEKSGSSVLNVYKFDKPVTAVSVNSDTITLQQSIEIDLIAGRTIHVEVVVTGDLTDDVTILAGTSYQTAFFGNLIEQGVKGATGIQGQTGLRGVTGFQGPTGAYGGPQGVTGVQGIQGIQGVTGIQGITGIGVGSRYSFYTHLSTDQLDTTGDNTLFAIPFDTTKFNIGNCFNTTTHKFITPKPGKYFFSLYVLYRTDTSHPAVTALIETPLINILNRNVCVTSTSTQITGIVDIQNTNDEVIPYFLVEGALKDVRIYTGSSFSGYLIE